MRAMLSLGVVVALAAFAGAEDKKADTKKADPTGTWKWETEFGGQKRTTTLKLKLDKDKLTGAVVGMDGKETPIEDGTYKDGEVAFNVTRERDGNKFTMKYKAKIDGDTIKGAATVNFGGEERKIDFEGKREEKKDK